MGNTVFLARSSDEVYPKHLSPDERVAFEIADSAEWKVIVDSGSVKVLDSEVANTRQGDQQSNGGATQASGGHLPETESQVQMVCFGTPGSRRCRHVHLRFHSTDREHHDVPFSVAAV